MTMPKDVSKLMGIDPAIIKAIQERVSSKTTEEEQKEVTSDNSEEEIGTNINSTELVNEAEVKFSPLIKKTTTDPQILNLILDELVQFPFQIKLRLILKETLQKVISVLIRYQYQMGIKRGITTAEIMRNISKKYHKHVELVLIFLCQKGYMYSMTYHGKIYYKITRPQIMQLTGLQQDLEE